MNEITFVTHNLSIGGSQKVIINLANEALKQDYSVNIIVLTNDLYLLNNITASEKLKIITCSKTASSSGFFKRLLIGFNFIKAVIQLKPAFIHSHLWQIDIVYLILLRLCYKIRIIHTVHSPGGAYFMDKFSHRLNVLIERCLVNYFSNIAVIVVSEETGQVVERVLKYQKKYYLIPNGVDTDQFAIKENSTDEAIPQGNRIYFVFPSRYQPSKGHTILFEAFAKIIREYPEVYLVLVGIGLKENLIDSSVNMGIADRVIFYGPSNNINFVISQCHFGVFPSQYEGHPIALCEMMAAGLAVAASDIRANKFVTNNGDGAILFQHDSAIDLSKAMRTLISDPAQAALIGSQAKQIIKEQFSAIKMFQLHLAVYHDSK